MRPTSKWHFVSGLPNGNPEIHTPGLLQLWGPIILCADLWLQRGLKQSCSPLQEISNDMSHATCTPRNRGDSWFLMVRTQVDNLTLDPSFGHNLCFRCSNGSCKPILDIYLPRTFQWYKERLNALSFGWNCSLKFRSPFWTLFLKMIVHLGVWGFIPSHSFALLGAWDVTIGLPSWIEPLQALALAMSPRLGLWHLPSRHRFCAFARPR